MYSLEDILSSIIAGLLLVGLSFATMVIGFGLEVQNWWVVVAYYVVTFLGIAFRSLGK